MIKERVLKLQQALEVGEAMLITSAPNRFYFTGFESSAGMIFVTRDTATFLIDFRYVEKAKATVTSCEVVLSTRSADEVKDLSDKHGIKRMYVETYALSVHAQKEYAELMPNVEVSADDKMDKLIEEIRAVKTDAEIESLKRAQALTDETFTYILDRIAAGRSERDVMLDMEFYMRKRGSEGVSFDFIVVSGKNSSLPHGVPTDKLIEKGDFLTMDFGALVDGYHADMTRTIAVGAVSDEQRLVYDTVLKAQLASIDAVKAGVVCKDVDKVARDIIYGAGFEGCFGHGLGHSVGVEIHENPSFNTRCETVLKSGMVMTVEPGIYLENKFGVRIEDMVVATDTGCINLTKSEKKLIVL